MISPERSACGGESPFSPIAQQFAEAQELLQRSQFSSIGPSRKPAVISFQCSKEEESSSAPLFKDEQKHAAIFIQTADENVQENIRAGPNLDLRLRSSEQLLGKTQSWTSNAAAAKDEEEEDKAPLVPIYKRDTVRGSRRIEPTLLLRGRFVDISWPEKLFFLVDALQFWAVLWLVFQPVLPYAWSSRTSFALFANLDFLHWSYRTLPADGAEPEIRLQSTGRILYLAGWASCPAGILAIHMFSKSIAIRKSTYTAHKRALSQAALILLSTLTYSCFLSGSLPLIFCQDQWEGCTSTGLFVTRVVCGIWVIAVALYMPWKLCNIIANNILSDYNRFHEKYIMIKESEYLLNLSDHWLTHHFWLFSSFRRTVLRAYHRPILLYLKLLLCLLYATMPRYPVAQSLAAVFIFFPYTCLTWYKKLYRMYTSWILQQTIFWFLSLFSGLCLAVAQSHKELFTSVFLTDRNLTLILVASHGLVLSIIGLLLLWCFVTSFFVQRTWPVTPKSADALGREYYGLILLVRNANQLLNDYSTSHQEQAPVTEIEGVMKQLEQLQNDEVSHPFRLTIIEVLEDITELYLETRTKSFMPAVDVEDVFAPVLFLALLLLGSE